MLPLPIASSRLVLDLPKGAFECVCELQGVVLVEDQGRANFQHVGVGALDSHSARHRVARDAMASSKHAA